MIGNRMRQARLAAGLTLDEVAQRLGELGQAITKQGLSKYEHNGSTPSASLLLKLARVLTVPSSYFLAEPELTVQWLAFRKHAQLAPARQEQIKAAALNVAEGQCWLQSILYSNDQPRVPALNISTFDEAEAAALDLRRAWGLGTAPIESVTQTIEDHGGVIVGWDQDEGRFDGLAAWINQRAPFIVVNTSTAPDRRRFSLAHELKHILSPSTEPENGDDEALANRFAGAFLVPAEVARRELGDRRRHLSFDELGMLKCKYGLSMQAWTHRALELDVIDRGQYDRLRAEFVAREATVREPVACEAPEEPTRLKQMTLRAFAEGIITEERALQLCPGCLTPQPAAQPAGRTYTARDLLRMPREERHRILAEAAEAAAEEYRTNPELTEFNALDSDDWEEWEYTDE
ncbi:MAG: hypothetical protein OJF49_003255 [Ktedonobacterales bacterium]|jgi:Zn-dependent peptidase ImmA (M78 family)/transcriptional regulator with XRE-family HTH domain|nr:MAG: hypothetical protein OJF49_003255 [Ktedonobacterales bacterium]